MASKRPAKPLQNFRTAAIVAKQTQRFSAGQGEREAAHKKAFTKWVNSKLAQRSPPMHINNVITDLQDGKALLCLLEVLTNRKLKKEKGNLRVHKINNVEQALVVLDECKVKLVGINGFDIVDGKTRVILGLVWSIILRFQVQGVMQQAGNDEASKSFAVEKQLLDWCKERLKGYDIKISDFTNSWRDGYAFNAILHSYRKDAFEFRSLSRIDDRKRLEHAFNQGEKNFGIPRILDPSDVYVDRPDKKLILLHLSNMYDYLEGSKAKEKPKAGVEEVLIQIDNDQVEGAPQPSLDELDTVSGRSPEERARAQEEIERKLEDLDAAVDDAEDRKPVSKESNLVDLETSKIHLDRHKKYMRTLESLDSCKNEVFTEVEQTIDEGYCDEKERETYYARMKQIDDKIKALRNKELKDLDTVSSSYSLFLSEKLKKIETSVENSEKKIKSTKEVANDYDTINKQLKEHQKFQEEMGDPAVVNTILEIDASDPAVDSATRNRLKSLSERWKAIWDWSENRKKKLANSLSDWQMFRDEQLVLLNWLGVKEKALKEIHNTDLTDEEALKKSTKELENIQKELDDEEHRLDHLHDLGQKLKQEAGKDKNAVKDIDKQLKDFDDCWNDIVKQVIDGKEKLNNANNKIKEMKTEMKEVNEWMDEARSLIDDVSEDMTPEDEEKLKEKVELKCDERPQIQVRVQRAKRLADDVKPLLDPESSKKLAKEVEDFEDKWKETNAALEGFSDKGYSDAKTDCCLVRVIKRKLKSTNN